MKIVNWSKQQVKENLVRLKDLRGNNKLLDNILLNNYTLTIEEQTLFPFFNGYFKPVKNVFTNPKFLTDHNQRVDGLVNLLNHIDCWTKTDEAKPYGSFMGIFPTNPENEYNIKQIYINTLGTGLEASDFYEENLKDFFHFKRIYKFPGPLIISEGLGYLTLSLGEKYENPIAQLVGVALMFTGALTQIDMTLIPSDHRALKEKVGRTDLFIDTYKDKL